MWRILVLQILKTQKPFKLLSFALKNFETKALKATTLLLDNDAHNLANFVTLRYTEGNKCLQCYKTTPIHAEISTKLDTPFQESDRVNNMNYTRVPGIELSSVISATMCVVKIIP